MQNHGLWLTFLYLTYILALIGAAIPMCMLCCCSRPPVKVRTHHTRNILLEAPAELHMQLAASLHLYRSEISLNTGSH